MEIERKFLVKEIPEDLYRRQSFQITQFYLSYEPEVRVRNIDDSFFLTVKSDGDLSRHEVDIKIDVLDYERLIYMAKSHIEKTRLKIKDSNFTFYLDIYNSIPGLLTVEVEFDNEPMAEAFLPRPWFGEEITYNVGFKNKNLARYGVPKEVTQEV